MKKYAVIVAGGAGKRMGTNVPKQFLMLGTKPVLWYTITAFLQAFNDMQVILVVPDEHLVTSLQIVQQTQAAERIQVTRGGETRFDSVKNGLAMVDGSAIVFVHDGVRCLVTKALIQRCYEQALKQGSAIPAVAATDTIRIDEGNTHYLADRSKVRIIQTPQTFKASLLVAAFEQPFNPQFTDEATVVEAFGTPVFLTEGDYENLKITRPIDLIIAESILRKRSALQEL